MSSLHYALILIQYKGFFKNYSQTYSHRRQLLILSHRRQLLILYYRLIFKPYILTAGPILDRNHLQIFLFFLFNLSTYSTPLERFERIKNSSDLSELKIVAN